MVVFIECCLFPRRASGGQVTLRCIVSVLSKIIHLAWRKVSFANDVPNKQRN
jgi:hypothetical protein